MEFFTRCTIFVRNNECVDAKNDAFDLAGWLQGVNVMLTTASMVERWKGGKNVENKYGFIMRWSML